MGKSTARHVPMARKEGLLVETLPDEVLVYDLDRKEAHCLNYSAALIWRHCDGKRNVSEIAGVISRHMNIAIDEDFVWYGLSHLSKTGLLEVDFARPDGQPNAARRNLIRKIGLAVSVPLVISVLAPKASAGFSCVGIACPGGSCPSPCMCEAGTCH